MAIPARQVTFVQIAQQIVAQFEQAFRRKMTNEGEYASVIVRRYGKNMEIRISSHPERLLITDAVRRALLSKDYDVSNLVMGRSLFVKMPVESIDVVETS
ncbi:hypothetical protein H7X68_02650 [Candidatus Saccharibacteria bacterium]|nr:hypothetical protein [Candidatus Saccharibacteria bacterium]